MASFQAVTDLLSRHGQEHLLACYQELPAEAQAGLLEQIADIDFDRLDGLIRTHVLAAPEAPVPDNVAPAPILPARPAEGSHEGGAESYAAARRRGEELIAAGKVAALAVAGGDGSRLGYSGPKGCFPVTPVKRKPLFQVFAEQVLATEKRYGGAVPWYVMTSQTNHQAIGEFFESNGYFGLDPGEVFFFAQGRMPAISLAGKVLLAAPGRIAWNPDGHGGCLTALARSGALDDMARRGIEQISYYQVDNPLVRCVDPLFIGLHAAAGADMSAKALPKRDPLEKVGNFCLSDGKVVVIEYSDMPEELAWATGPDGKRLFDAGSIAIHVLARSFVEHLAVGGARRLPFHRALKSVAHAGPDGKVVEPAEPNAVKLEMFIFDALPLAGKAVLLETIRGEEFSPLKKAEGDDSLVTCLSDQVARAARWLEAAGVAVPRDADGEPDATIEISPLLALEAGDLAGKIDSGVTVKPGEKVYFDESGKASVVA